MNAAITWWPVGHHLLPAGSNLTEDDQMRLQYQLDIAERNADRADEVLAMAQASGVEPEELAHLRDKAHAVRITYYDTLNADLAL